MRDRPRSMPRGGLHLHGYSMPGFHPRHKTQETLEAGMGTFDTCAGEGDPTFTEWMRTMSYEVSGTHRLSLKFCSVWNDHTAAP